MSYIGQRPVVGRYIKLDQISSGFNGSNTGFSMTAGSQAVFPGTARNLLLSLGGVIQEPDTDFTISGSTLTFTTPPVANTTFFGVIYGDMQATGTPSDGTVLPASIASSGNFSFPEVTVTGDLNAAGDIVHIDDTNTKIRFSDADQIKLETGAVQRLKLDNTEVVFNDDGASVDFRVEGDTSTHLLFVDASADKIGIGVSNPANTLEISGTFQSSTDANTASYTQAFNLTNAINADFNVHLKTGSTTIGSGTTTPLCFHIGGTANERMRIDSSGNVGIGTTSPSTRLEVKQDNGVAYNDRVQTASYNAARFFNSSGHTGAGAFTGMQFGITGDSQNRICSIGMITEASNNRKSSLVFATDDDGNRTEKLRITGDGNVGIGTTSPSSQLDGASNLVIGNTSEADSGMTFVTSSSGQGLIHFSDAVSGNERFDGFIGYEQNNRAFKFGTAQTEKMRIDSSGRLFLGLTTLQYPKKLNIQGESGSIIHLNNYNTTTYAANTSTAIEFNVNTGNTGNQTGACELRAFKENGTNGDNARALSFYTGVNGGSPTERMRIDSSGNVGIGTTSPSTKLHVNGNITAANSIVSDNLSGRNMIINGDMRIAQRATSGTFSSSGTSYPSIDRIKFARNGVTGTVAQEGDAPAGKGFHFSAKMTTTSAVGSIAAGNVLQFKYLIERQDCVRLGYGDASAKTSVLSFYVKSSLTGTFGVGFTRNSRVQSHNITYSSANTWQFVEVVVPGDTSTAINGGMTDTGMSILITISAGGNTIDGGAVNTWVGFHNSYTGGGATMQHLTNNGSTFQITGLQYEIGSKATPFEHKLIGEELLRCQRYYQEVLFNENNTGGGILRASNSNMFQQPASIQQFVEMRAAASGAVISSNSLVYCRRLNGSSSDITASVSHAGGTTHGFINIRLTGTSSGTFVNEEPYVWWCRESDGQIMFSQDAEL